MDRQKLENEFIELFNRYHIYSNPTLLKIMVLDYVNKILVGCLGGAKTLGGMNYGIMYINDGKKCFGDIIQLTSRFTNTPTLADFEISKQANHTTHALLSDYCMTMDKLSNEELQQLIANIKQGTVNNIKKYADEPIYSIFINGYKDKNLLLSKLHRSIKVINQDACRGAYYCVIYRNIAVMRISYYNKESIISLKDYLNKLENE